MSATRPSPREQRTIALALGLLLAAVLVTRGVIPAWKHWSAREQAIDVARDRVARLRALSRDQGQLIAVAQSSQNMPNGAGTFRGRTPALVASNVQSLLQDFARMSRVSISRLEVLGFADSTASPDSGVRASVSATTDVYGLADFLTRLQASRVVLAVDEVSVTPNPVLRGNLLQVALTVRAPFVVEP